MCDPSSESIATPIQCRRLAHPFRDRGFEACPRDSKPLRCAKEPGRLFSALQTLLGYFLPQHFSGVRRSRGVG